MLSKNKIKFLRALQRKKDRNISGLFILEGQKLVTEILSNSLDWQEIYATENWLKKYPSLTEDYRVYKINKNDLNQISSLKSPNDVLMVLKQFPIKNFLNAKNDSLILALDGINNPGNLGAIIRIADWFGIQHILCSINTVDMYNPKVVQSAMGSIQRVQLHYGNLLDMISKFEFHKLYASDLSGHSIYNKNIDEKIILLMGSESHGISNELYPLVKEIVTIPSYNSSSIDSLNVSIAAGIIISQIRSNKIKKINFKSNVLL